MRESKGKKKEEKNKKGRLNERPRELERKEKKRKINDRV